MSIELRPCCCLGGGVVGGLPAAAVVAAAAAASDHAASIMAAAEAAAALFSEVEVEVALAEAEVAEAEGGGGPLCPATGMARKALGLQRLCDTCALVSNISLSSKALLPCSTFSLLLQKKRTYFFLALLSRVVQKERVSCLLLY